MRTFLKIFITLVVVAGAFIAYLSTQPAAALRGPTSRPAPQPMLRGTEGMLIAEGSNAWVRQFDDEGRLSSRFRADKWEPEKGGLVRVLRPEAELFLKAGKDKDGRDKPRAMVRIRGDNGEVVVQSLPDAAATEKPLASSQGAPTSGAKGQSAGPAQPPRSGRLNGVVIDVFETEHDTTPRVTLRTNNIVFDNDTFRLSTESYRAPDGSTVPPDEVPVTVDGPDFEFLGRGLTVRWNDLEERLDLLRVAHGDHLVIKNPGALSGSGGLPLSVPSAGAPTAAVDTTVPQLGMLASTDRGAAVAMAQTDRRSRRRGDARRQAADVPAPAPASKPARKKRKENDGSKRDDEQPPYRAAFNDDVRVLQGEQQVATARLMNVDFLFGDHKGDRPTSRPSSTRPADTAPSAATDATATQPTATQPAVATEPLTTQPGADDATTRPTTAPANQPVTVYWTGELIVTPLLAAAPASAPATAPATAPVTPPPGGIDGPLTPGEARVELVGAPAVVTRDTLEVKTSRFVYRTDGRVAIDGGGEFPNVLITRRPDSGDGPATTVTTEGLAYSRGEQVATLRGQSRVLAPISSDRTKGGGPDGAPGMLDAAWRDSATFRLVGQREDELSVEYASLEGKVDVKAPQGLVRSERLELSFDPPTAKARATTAPATQPGAGDAVASVAQRGRGASASTPNLRRVVATDNVYTEFNDAKEGKRSVECQRLAVETAVSPAGQLYPKLVDASGGVHAGTGQQDLSAGHVLLALRPVARAGTTRPAGHAELPAGAGQAEPAVADAAVAARISARDAAPKEDEPLVELESMTATDAVRVASADGGVATGRKLVVTGGGGGGEYHVELTGDPARVEQAQGNGTLTGPRIEVDPTTGVAHVVGPGTLRAVQRDEQKGAAPVVADAAAAGVVAAATPGRPVEVTWADGADVRANDNRIDIRGAVSLWLTDTDGSVRTANAGRVSIELAEKAPADKERDDAPRDEDSKPAPRGAGALALGGAVNGDPFKDKELAKVHLYDNAAVNSKLLGDDGAVLRQFHLKSQTITYDARTRHLSVPTVGQMLVEVHDAAEANADAKQAKAQQGAGAVAGGNGTTAFEWHQSMEYDEAAGRAVMDGSVIVSHQPDRKDDPPVLIDADTLTANFDPQQGDAGAAGKGPAGEGAVKLQLRELNARGNIVITRQGAELSAAEIRYDPSNEWVIARGTDRNPATFMPPGGSGAVRAGELWLNTETWAVKIRDVNSRVGLPPR
jgi:hypothetical protein